MESNIIFVEVKDIPRDIAILFRRDIESINRVTKIGKYININIEYAEFKKEELMKIVSHPSFVKIGDSQFPHTIRLQFLN
jgi:hypothetical protein